MQNYKVNLCFSMIDVKPMVVEITVRRLGDNDPVEFLPSFCQHVDQLNKQTINNGIYFVV